jgi:hypothetical protein
MRDNRVARPAAARVFPIHASTDWLALKTPEASFLHVLLDEFNLSYREAREVVSAARELLGLDRPTGRSLS